MSSLPVAATRIFGVSARDASRVVLIRRGPSKQVMLITWDTVKHHFFSGQWLKGRIYEERCDLSPSGEKFVYLAANHKGPISTWNAVSRPPYLTALVLWPNMGTWGGGGLFESERTLSLNSTYLGLRPAEGFKVPKDLKVVPIASWAGRGEDDPIRSMRMRRDGWELADEGKHAERSKGGHFWWEWLVPERWRKTRGQVTLERRLLGLHEQDGPWRVQEHHLLDPQGGLLADLGRSDWADWSRSDELLFAREGRVYRIAIAKGGVPGVPEELMDLRGLKFEQVPPPREALEWNTKVKGRRLT